MKDRTGAQYLGSEDLALLQECFDRIIERTAMLRDSDLADIVAARLMDAFNSGVTDRRELMRRADPSLPPI